MTFQLSRRRRRRRAPLSGELAAFAAGAGLMYLLDPRGGGRRRSEMRQRTARVLRDVEGTVQAGARDLGHRARGLAHEAAARVERDQAPDDVIVERVRAKLGRLAAHPSAIRVTARGGQVVLAGPVFSAEHAQVLRGVRLVRGVRSVEDRLEPHAHAEGVPALQGGGPRRGPRPDPLQRHWAPRTRLVAGVAGTALVVRGLFGSGLGRIPSGLAGAALLGKVMGDAGIVPRDAPLAARAAGGRAARQAGRRHGERPGEGAWRGEPEERRGGAGRRGGGQGGGHGGWSAGSEAGGSELASGPGPGWVAPERGAHVREGDLGETPAVEPEEGREGAEGGEGAPREEPSS